MRAKRKPEKPKDTKPHPVMISVSGIRGIVGQGLTPRLILDYSAAVGSFFGGGKILVGRDSRVSGDMVKHAVFSGLMSVGCDPVDLGICPTPTVQMAVKNSDASGGIIITASHNPKEWNALKLVRPDGLFLEPDEGEEIRKTVESGGIRFAAWDRLGRGSSLEGSIENHIRAILELPLLDLKAIRKRHFSVVYDCVNGAGGLILPQLLDAFGCKALGIHVDPTGIFSRPPEPVAENLKDLCREVQRRKAEVGFAVDPDVDRLAIAAENGEPIGEEYTVTLATYLVLKRKKGPVVLNMSTTKAAEDVALEAGVPVHRTPVGEIHVARTMREVGAVIGGEGNGGVLLPELHLGRDAPLAIALILQLLTEERRPMTQVWKSMPQYVMTKAKLNVESDPAGILNRLIEKNRHERINLADGLKIEWEDSWVHIRPSNTEPILRILAEARTDKESAALCRAYVQEVKKAAQH